MSRYNPRHDIGPLLGAAEQWKSRCLLQDGSLLTDAMLWTPEYLDELEQHYVRNPQEGGDSFTDKLKYQLANASPEAIRLMAELHWLLLVFSANIKPATKRELIAGIWKLSGDDEVPQSPLLEDAVLVGAGSTGTGYNTHRWRELVFLIEVLQAFKRLDEKGRRSLLASPWEFAPWLDSQPGADTRQLRHILCFLLFPDSFEHISVTRDKKTILEAVGNYSRPKLEQMSLTEVDQALLSLRQSLEQQASGPVDFHESPWIEQWNPSPTAWLLLWNPADWTWESFQDDRLRIARGETRIIRWLTGSSELREGDSFFLMRLGQEPRGLIGRGNIVSAPYEDKHHDPERAARGETARYVDIALTDLRDPAVDAFLSLSDLEKGNTDGQNWTPQASGIAIKPRSARLVAGLWNRLTPVQVPLVAVAQTPEQKAIAIGNPVNLILYGPPGTGKTHYWSTHLKPRYETQASQVSTAEWLEEQLANSSWWETVALALADLEEKRCSTTVNEIVVHPFFKAKARLQGAPTAPTCEPPAGAFCRRTRWKNQKR